MKNWKTSVCGLVIAGVTAVEAYQGNGGWKGYLMAAGIAMFGLLVKDFDVTGGTSQQ
jgi:hypothetical protein